MKDILTAAARGKLLEPIASDDAAISSGTNNPTLFTAVPCGTGWRVKVLSPAGETSLLGIFDGRLSALGAAVLLAAQSDGHVLP